MAAYSRLTAGGWRNGDDATAQARVGTSGWYQVYAVVADTTDPVLSDVGLVATSATELTGSVTTTEAGPCWAVLYPAALGAPSAAQIKAGTDVNGTAAVQHVNWQYFESGLNQILFTMGSAGTAYKFSAVQDDLADPANTSNVITSLSATTDSPDVTGPDFGAATLDAGTKTDTTVALSTSAVATDAVGVTGYEWSSDDGATYPFTSLSNAFTFTALTALTSYPFRVRAYDAAGNRSAHLSLTTSTYRAGDTAANIIANTAAIPGVQQKGAQYELALTKLSTDWLSYYEVTPPTPSGGTLTPFADGSFTYVGPEPATWVIQAEVNMVEEASTTTTTLYADEPADEISPVISSPTGAALGANGAAGSFSTDEGNGTAYWITTANSTELEAAVEAGSSQSVTASGVQFVTSSGLTPETNYYNHFFQRDLAGNPSNVISSAMFTTPAAGEVVGGSRPGEKTMHSCMKPAMYPAMNKG